MRRSSCFGHTIACPAIAGWLATVLAGQVFILFLHPRYTALPQDANPLNEIPKKFFRALEKTGFRRAYENMDWYACRARSRRSCAQTLIVRVSRVITRR